MPTILITGANRGLGLEFVRQYAESGASIIACCRTPAQATKLKALADKHPSIRIETLDVADFGSIRDLAARLNGSAIDILINNAGIYSGTGQRDDDSQEFGTIDADAWEHVLHTNTIAPIMITQAFLSCITRGKEKKIALVTSKMGSIAEMGSGYIAYRTSKAALNAAMVTISHDLREKGIAIVNLHPGWVKTDMGGPAAPLDPETSVHGMIKVIGGLSLSNTGRFVGYDGKEIAW